MHVPINVKSPNNLSEWQMGFNSAFKGLRVRNDIKIERIMKSVPHKHIRFECSQIMNEDGVA
jgi:hypothetical protein